MLRVRSGPVSGVGWHNSVTVRVMMIGYARRGEALSVAPGGQDQDRSEIKLFG